MTGKRYDHPHKVTYYEGDSTSKATLPMLISMLIEVSEMQDHSLSGDLNITETYGVTWVITQYEMRIKRMPNVGEEVRLFTEADSYNKFFCYRNFWVEDLDGTRIVDIQSTFVLMNLTTRKIAKVEDAIIAPFECEKVLRVERRANPVKVVKEESEHQPYRIRYFDIDTNNHVNNAKYFEWMLDSLGYDFLTTHDLCGVNIKYDKEVHYGQTVTSYWQVDADIDDQFTDLGEVIETDHLICDGEENYCEASFAWRRK